MTMSMERGFRHWHGDIETTDTPGEAGLTFACKLQTEIDFIGRKVVEEQKKTGIER